jgi:general secretion pathway protein G
MKRVEMQTGRRGFTLVEMLVVIVIIGILVSLISVAAYQALKKATVTRNITEIQQLGTALTNFKTKFGFYPPSRMLLCERYADYANPMWDQTLAADSLQVLTTMFPRLDITSWQSPGAFLDWNGNGQPDGAVLLEGDQCLVFFLGGIPAASSATGGGANTPPGCLGFSNNPKNPTDPSDLSSTTGRIGPFFTFASNRLVIYGPQWLQSPHMWANPQRATGSSFYSYLDNYGTSDGNGGYLAGSPYAYFSAYAFKTAKNGYHRYTSPAPPAQAGIAWYSDCSWCTGQTATGSFYATYPLAEALKPSVRYLQPDSYQIISAGGDVNFGPGSTPTTAGATVTLSPTWTPATGPNQPGYQTSDSGNDDQANFSSSTLGSGAQ